MEKENKFMIFRIILTIIALILAIVLKNEVIKNIIFLLAYLIIGLDILIKSIKNILRGDFLDENFLMSIATIGAIAIRKMPEAVSVMLLYQIGELFQDMAVDSSKKSISDLMEIRSDYANKYINGKEKRVSPEEIKIGDIIIVKPGEKVPLDGIVHEGNSLVDTKAITGEPVPKAIQVSDEIISGYINLNSILKIRVTKEFKESTVSQILTLIEDAANKKSKSEKFITKFAKIYTPLVVLAAIIIAIMPTIFFGVETFTTWFSRALIFLVVSCPCALVISVPLGFFTGIGIASKHGILVKGSNYLENLSKVERIVFDKTGTLTEGVFEIQKVVPNDIKAFDLIKYAAYAENYSNHPIAISIKKAYNKEIDEGKITSIEEISGKGIKANIFGKDVLVGNEKLLKDRQIDFKVTNTIGSIVYMAINKKYAGYIVISDKIKENSKDVINNLENKFKIKTTILTGDSKKNTKQIASTIGINDYQAELLPTDKLSKLEEILSKKSKNAKVAFIGDGINDSPVLTRADIGIAMGKIGADAAIEASDIVIMNDDIRNIERAIKISKRTEIIVKQNIIFAITVKIIILVLGAIGAANMWLAVFADVGVSIICILNSLKNFRFSNKMNEI